MDQQLPSQEPLAKTSFIKTKFFLALLLLLFFGLLLFLAFSVFLNKSEKKVSQPVSSKKEVVSAKPFPLSKSFNKAFWQGPFSCPIAASFCKADKSYKNNLLMANVLSGSSLFASFDGKVDVLTTTASLPNNKKEEYTTVVLTNLDRGLLAYYHFNGKAEKKEKVKEGEVIATANGKALVTYDNNSFVFQLINLDVNSQTVANLKIGDFK